MRASIAALEEGAWPKRELLAELSADPELDDAGARTAPLLYAHLTAAGSADACANLRTNLGRLAERWEGTPEGRILQLTLDGEARTAGSNATKQLLLHAGLKAAAEAIAHPPADGAALAAQLLAGARWAVATDAHGRPLQEATVLALAQNCLEHAEAVLPAEHPAREAIAPFDRSPPAVSELSETSILGLRIGRLRYALEQDAAPPEFPAGTRSMPDLSLRAVLNGALLEKFSPEIPGAQAIKIDHSTQGALENCYYVAAWSAAIERDPELFTRCAERDGERVRFTLHVPGEGGSKKEELIDPIFYVDTRGELLYAGDRRHTWMALAEKAFAYARRAHASYDSLAFGTGAEGFRAIFGDEDAIRRPLDLAARGEPLEVLAAELERLIAEKIPVTAGTHPIPARYRDNDLTAGHAYVLRGIRKVGDGWEVALRNMQREASAEPSAWFDRAREKHRPMERERRVLDHIKNPGDLTLRLEDFDRLFRHFDAARPCPLGQS